MSQPSPSTPPAPQHDAEHAALQPPRSRLVLALDIVLVRLRFIGLLVAVMLVAAYWDDVAARVERWTHGPGDAPYETASDVEYFCPMHPHIVRAEPGACPICGMPLSRRQKGGRAALPEGVLARVQFSPYRIAQGGIRTTAVGWRPLVREVRTVGFVEYDERRLARISARFPGRVESLAVDFTGLAVERGRPLASLYSPELLAAEESLLAALRESQSAADPQRAARSAALVRAARSRLELWGLLPEQIAAIEDSGVASATVEVLSPLAGVVTRKAVVVGDYVDEGAALFDVADLSTVWVKAAVYEDDLALVRPDAQVEATASAFPGETFTGKVAFVDPFLDRATRTAGVRLDLPNPNRRLLPGMYVMASVRVPFAEIEPFRSQPQPAALAEPRVVWWCPMHPDVVRDAPGNCDACGGMQLVRKELPAGPAPGDVLAVPETAVVDTGRRRVVYVESEPGVFDAHEVVLGPRAGAWYPVIGGVEAGARIATAGAFLVDAETRLDPAAAGAYFGASSAPAGAAPPTPTAPTAPDAHGGHSGHGEHGR